MFKSVTHPKLWMESRRSWAGQDIESCALVFKETLKIEERGVPEGQEDPPVVKSTLNLRNSVGQSWPNLFRAISERDLRLAKREVFQHGISRGKRRFMGTHRPPWLLPLPAPSKSSASIEHALFDHRIDPWSQYEFLHGTHLMGILEKHKKEIIWIPVEVTCLELNLLERDRIPFEEITHIEVESQYQGLKVVFGKRAWILWTGDEGLTSALVSYISWKIQPLISFFSLLTTSRLAGLSQEMGEEEPLHIQLVIRWVRIHSLDEDGDIIKEGPMYIRLPSTPIIEPWPLAYLEIRHGHLVISQNARHTPLYSLSLSHINDVHASDEGILKLKTSLGVLSLSPYCEPQSDAGSHVAEWLQAFQSCLNQESSEEKQKLMEKGQDEGSALLLVYPSLLVMTSAIPPWKTLARNKIILLEKISVSRTSDPLCCTLVWAGEEINEESNGGDWVLHLPSSSALQNLLATLPHLHDSFEKSMEDKGSL